MDQKSIILDSNILVRAVLGKRVPYLLSIYADYVHFITADQCYKEVQKHLPTILKKRGISIETVTSTIKNLQKVVKSSTVCKH